jgi:hypothetical protein
VDYSVFCGEWCIGRIYENSLALLGELNHALDQVVRKAGGL